jgi:hypothetical protein
MKTMHRYAVVIIYIQLKDSEHNKGGMVYIDGRLKASRNIVGLINSTRPDTTRKQPNFIFEGCEENQIFVCAVKTIVVGEELLVDYDLNQIDGSTTIMG